MIKWGGLLVQVENKLPGINIDAVDDHFVMQVRTGGAPGHANRGDLLAPCHPLAGLHLGAATANFLVGKNSRRPEVGQV